MCDIHLGRGDNDEDFATITIRNSKTDQFNEGGHETLKAVPGHICPVKTIARLITLRDWSNTSEEKVFGGWFRNRLCATFRMAGSAVGIPASRIGNHSLRSGGATAMWRAGYDIEVIKRWGRWKAASPQGYLWDDHRVLATIGQGMLLTKGNTYQFAAQGVTTYDQWASNSGRAGENESRLGQRGVSNAGRAGGKGPQWGRRNSTDYLGNNPRERM